MANVNILEGMECPQCKSDGPYRIRAHVLVLMDDDGTLDDLSGSEWEHDTQCECEGCDYSGTVKDFLIDKKHASESVTINDEKIADLERLKNHLEQFINDPEYRKELSRGFRGFCASSDDFLALEAVTAYLDQLTKKEAAP